MSLTPEQYRRVVFGAGFLLALIIVTGAAVRLTSSGLGCSDWPTCTADSLAPEWSYHGWIEFGNRLLSGVVALAAIGAVLSAKWRDPFDPRLVRIAWGLVVGVLAQVLLGGAVVLLELNPISVTAHFLLSMVLMTNVIVLYRAAGPDRPALTEPISSAATAHLAIGVIVLLTGTVVTGAGPNSGDARADRLPFELNTVARIHSVAVWLFLALTLALAYTLSQRRRLDRPIQTLVSVILAQGALGYAQYFTGVPPLLVQFHVIGSIAVWCSTVWVFLWMRDLPLHESAPQRETVPA